MTLSDVGKLEEIMKLKSQSVLIPITATLGFAGIAAMGFNFRVGLFVFAIAIAVLVYGIKVTQPAQPIRYVPPISTISSEFNMRGPSKLDTILKSEDGHTSQPDRQTFHTLLKSLTDNQCDAQAHVYYIGDAPITARDIVKEIAVQAEEHGDDVEGLAKVMPKIYERFWENSHSAFEQFGADTYLVNAYIARKSMIDVDSNLENLPK